MKKQVKTITDEELALRKRKLKSLRIVMIIFDLIIVGLLIFQIKTDTFTLMPYIMLILCNLVTFLIKPTF
mgnify:FL=1